MTRLLKFIAAALLLAAPAFGATGSLGGAITDAVSISISGMSYSTARWIVNTAGTAKVTTEITLDGVNWLPAAFSQRVDAVSANQQVAAWQNTTPVAGSYDTPLPSNVLAFRVRCGTVGTATIVSVTGGQPYTPSEQVVAVLWDTTSAVNTAQDTGTLDTSGWAQLIIVATQPAAGAATCMQIDDAGSSAGTLITLPGASTSWVTMGPGIMPASSSITPTANTFSGGYPLPKRIRWQETAVAALTSRLRIEARR